MSGPTEPLASEVDVQPRLREMPYYVATVRVGGIERVLR